MKPKKIAVCGKCGSDQVQFDAWSGWDAESQQFILLTHFDSNECRSCDAKGSVKWVTKPPELVPVEFGDLKDGEQYLVRNRDGRYVLITYRNGVDANPTYEGRWLVK